jgi:hypothetical protein
VTDGVTFPVYVLAMDCGEVTKVSSVQVMQRHMEPFDVQNNEYKAWDAEGRILKLAIGETRQSWFIVEPTNDAKNEQEFATLKAKAESRQR